MQPTPLPPQEGQRKLVSRTITELGVWEQIYSTAGPQVTINCPVCQVEEVSSPTELLETKARFLIIPLWWFRCVQAQCGACQSLLRFRHLSLEELGTATVHELSRHLVPGRYQPFTWKTGVLVLACLVTFWIPLAGPIVGFVVFRKTRHVTGGIWWGTVIACLVLGSLLTLGLLTGVVMGLLGLLPKR